MAGQLSATGSTGGAQPPATTVIDGIFRALSDPTRRSVIERLGTRPASVTELAAEYPMALPSFVEHLKMLEGTGLVRSKKVGRVRTYELTPGHLQIATDWLDRQRAIWEARLDRLDAYLLAMKKEMQE